MVLPTGAARRALAGLGIVAVLFTPTGVRSEAGQALTRRDALFAATLAPGDHPGVVQRTVRVDPAAVSIPPSVPAAALMAAMVTVILSAWRIRRGGRVAAPSSLGPVLLRAPTRSPPVLFVPR